MRLRTVAAESSLSVAFGQSPGTFLIAFPFMMTRSWANDRLAGAVLMVEAAVHLHALPRMLAKFQMACLDLVQGSPGL